MRCFQMYAGRWAAFLFAVGVLCGPVPFDTWASRAVAEFVSLTSAQDNTLYQYDPNDVSSRFNSNGSGNFFSAGRSRKRSQIRRGLIRFDLSGIPAGARVVEGSARLDLYVVSVPRKDASPRPVWLVRLAGLGRPWGEGASATQAGVSGAGSGAAAQENDATWFHTAYDPAVDDQITFLPDGPGFWPQQGALGSGALDPWSLYGNPAATLESVIGPVSLSSAGIEADINAWLRDGSSNFGWIVLGDETIQGDDVSSNRGFASREHANADFRPLLTFQYVPEPGSAVLLAAGLVVLLGWGWRKSR